MIFQPVPSDDLLHFKFIKEEYTKMEVSSRGNNSEGSEFLYDFLHCPLCSWGFPDAPLLTHHIKSEHRDWTLYKVISGENEIHRISDCEVLEEVDDINQHALCSNGNNNAVAAEVSKVTVKHLPEVSLCSDILNVSDSDNEVEIIEPNSEGYYSWKLKTVPPIYDISVSETESENGEETGILRCESDEIFVRSFHGTGYIKAEESDSDVIYNDKSEEYLRLCKKPDGKSYIRKDNDRRYKGEKRIVDIRSGKMFLGQKNFRKHRGGKIIIASVPSCRVWVDQGTSDNATAKSSVGLESTSVDRKVSCLHRNLTLQKCTSSDLGSSEVTPPSPNKLNLFNNSMNINIINVPHGSTPMQNDLIDGGKYPANAVDSSDCSIVAEGLGSYTTLSVIEQSEPLNSIDIISCKIKAESSLNNCSATTEVAFASQNDSENKCQSKLLKDFNDKIRSTDSSKVDLEETVDANESIFRLTSDNAGMKDVLPKTSYSVQKECVDSAEKARTEDELTDNIRRLSINQDVFGRANFCSLSDSDKQESLNCRKGCLNLNIKNIPAKSTKESDGSLIVPDNFDETTSRRVESNFVSWDNNGSDSAGDLNDQSKNVNCSANVKKIHVNATNLADCDMTAKGSVNCEKSKIVSDSAKVDSEGTDKFENPSCASEQFIMKDIDCNPMDSAVNQTTKQIRQDPSVPEEACVKVGSTKSDGTFAVPYYPSHRRLKRSFLSVGVSSPVSGYRKRKSVSKNSLGNLKNALTKEFKNVDGDIVGQCVNLDEQETISSRREQYMPCSSQPQDKNVSAVNPAEEDCQVSSGYVSEKSLYISSGKGQIKAESSNMCTAKKIVSIDDETLRAEIPEYICDIANKSTNAYVDDANFKNNTKESACSGTRSQIDETSDCQNLTEVYGLKTTTSTLTHSKGYKCKKCLMDLKDCQSLKSHRCLVPGLKPFKCSKCLFSFSRKRHLVLHVQKCSRKRERQTLVDQKSNHTGILRNKIESEINCFICLKRVNSKFQLVQHLFRFHADVVKQDTVKSKILSNLDIIEDWDSEVTTNCIPKTDVESFQTTGNADHLDLTENYPEDSYSVKDQIVTLDQPNSLQEIIERGDISCQENPSAIVNVSKDDCESHDRKNSNLDITEDWDFEVATNCNLNNDAESFQTTANANHLDLTANYLEECHSAKHQIVSLGQIKRVQEIIERGDISSQKNPSAVENVSKDDCDNHDRQNSENIIVDMGSPANKNILNERKSSEPLSNPLDCQANKNALEEEDACHDRKKSKEIISDIMKYLSNDLLLAKQENSSICPNYTRFSAKLPICMYCGKKFVRNNGFRSHMLECVNNRAGKICNNSSTSKPTDGENVLNYNEQVENTVVEGKSVPIDLEGRISTSNLELKEKSFESLVCSSLFSGKQSFQDHPVTQKSAESVEFSNGDDASAMVETIREKTSVCVSETVNYAYVDEEPITKPFIKEKSITTEIQNNSIETDPSITFEKINAPLRVPMSSRIHKCIFCKKSYVSKHTLKYHLLKFHNYKVKRKKKAKLYKCINCSKAYSSKYTLKYHYQGCSDVNPIICEFCGKAFGIKYNLAYHYERCAGRSISKVDIPDKAAYKCFYCDRRYVSKYTLEYHLRKCKIVTCAFGNEEDFMEVDKSEIGVFEHHTGVSNDRQEVLETKKLYKCFECGRSFRSYYSLYYHKVNKHSDLMMIKASGNIPLKQGACIRIPNFEDSKQTIDDAITCEKSCSADPVFQVEEQVTCSQKDNYCKNYPDFLSQHLIFKERRDSSPVESNICEEKRQTVVNSEKVSNKQVNVSEVNDFLGFTASLVCNYCGIAFADALYFKLHLTKHRNNLSVDGHRKTFELKVLVEKLDNGTSDGIPRHVTLKKKNSTSDLGAITVGDLSKIVKLETPDNRHDKYDGYLHKCRAEENHHNRNDGLPYKKNYLENLCFSEATSSGKKLNKLTKKLIFDDEFSYKSTGKFRHTRCLSSSAQGMYFKCSVHGNICECNASAVQQKHMHTNENATFTSKYVHRREELRKHLISRVLDTTKAKAEEKAQHGYRHSCKKCGKIFKKNAHLCLPRYYCLECGKSFKYTSCLNRHFVYFHPEVKPLEGKSFSVGKP